MPSYKQREEWQLAAIESEAFPAVNRLGAKCVLKHYSACDIANVIFKKRLELIRMVCTDWVLAVFVNSSTFGVLDLESLDTDLADLLDSVY